VLKAERRERILGRLAAEGRVVATELQAELGVSGYTIRRDLDELAGERRLQRVHGGALARSTVPVTYEGRQAEAVPGKLAAARAAATLLEPGQVVILDGGSTALHLAEAVPDGFQGTFVTHSPPVAAALGRRPGLEVVVIGGTLEPRAMVAVGARALEGFARVRADVCFLGIWSLHAAEGISEGYHEEAEVRRVMVGRADRVVGLASREKLGTVAPFAVAPATALTDLATEPDAPAELLRPFEELGIRVVRSA
jgi:DeoR/GlpR family transcriptional regulator of sugar metabolism